VIPCLALALTGVLTVFTRKSGLLRRRNRAVTLIEAVLYISIALALIVGGLVFFQQASTAARTSTMVRQLSATLAETRILVKDMTLPVGPTEGLNITPLVISAGAVPQDMVASATTLSNPFGGTTTINAVESPGLFGQVITVTATNVPQGVCARLLAATSGANTFTGGGKGVSTIVSYGLLASGAMASGITPAAVGNTRAYDMNPTQAGWMCKYGAAAYTDQTTQPSSAPLSGNVTVIMRFNDLEA
jgi:hypothetical protein